MLGGEVAIYDQQLRSRFRLATRALAASPRRRSSWRLISCTSTGVTSARSSATTGVGQEHEGAELSEAALGPEGGPESQALIEGDGVEAVFDHGADADEPKAVFDEDAQVACGGIGNPDGREALVLKKVEEVAGVAAIRFGLAHDHGPDLGGFADEQGMAESLQERVKPQGVSGAFDADRDRRGQGRVELLDGIAGMSQLLLG